MDEVLQKKNSFIDFLAKYDKYNENFKENFNPILNKACQMKIDTNAKNQDVLNNQYIRKKLTLKDNLKKIINDDDKSFKIRIKNILRSSMFSVIVTIAVLILLFLDDIRLLAINKYYDNSVDIILVSFFTFLVVEVIIFAFFIKQYRFTIFFWLDIMSILTLIPEINFFFPIKGDYYVDDHNHS